MVAKKKSTRNTTRNTTRSAGSRRKGAGTSRTVRSVKGKAPSTRTRSSPRSTRTKTAKKNAKKNAKKSSTTRRNTSRSTRTSPVRTAAKKAPSTARQRATRSMLKSKYHPDTSKIVPDTSVLIEGALSKQLEQAALEVKEIIIPEAVLAELEAQANKRKEIGYLGLEEVERLQQQAKVQGFTVRFAGTRPEEFEIKYAKSGEIDSLIRALAEQENAVLFTADIVQGRVAKARGVAVIFYRHEFNKPNMEIEDFFDDETMSIHIKENTPVFAKKGKPGAWRFETVQKNYATHQELERWAKQIIEAANIMRDGFVEIERKGSTIAQIGRYRIVITRPPFADGYEITAVRPVKHLSITDYKLTEKLQERLDRQAEGILIAGAPGHGKSTFAQALAEYYATKKKIIKTVEAPRDMVLPDEITQYAISHGSSEEVHDILLLSRPDYTFFDEMRNTDDFKLFADMRLSGVGMIGVMHATKTIDAIQRFLGRIELGVIPHVVDTVVFIKDGAIGNVYAITMTVKVPSGMTEADLARPVVEVHDFESGTLQFEIYTYGEQTVVIPVKGGGAEKPVHKFANAGITEFFRKYARDPVVEVKSDNKVVLYVDDDEAGALIGRGGEHIQQLEQELGMSIDVETRKDRAPTRGTGSRTSGREPARRAPTRGRGKGLKFHVQESKTSIGLELGHKLANRDVDIFVDGEFLLTAHASRKGKVKLAKRNKMVRVLQDGLDDGSVEVRRSQ